MENKEFKAVYPGWETVRKLGSGSFGAVYEIQRDLFGKIEKAALKQISIPQDENDVEELTSTGYDEAGITAHYQGFLADIVKEYQLMAEMKGHTNVVYCDDIRYVQKDDGFGWDVYIKMELLTPLMKALDRVTEEREILKLGRDLANALVLCRSRNIIHRDIKPQNIFVSKDGDYKLGDFGIAKTAEKTSGGTKIGTYNYMAPEVYNNQPYGHGADIYSLGLVLYWLLNDRRLPFYPAPPAVPRSMDMEQARMLRFRGEPLPPPAHGSEAFKRIVLKACAFDPKNRYLTAEEMLRDLEHVGEGPEKEEAKAPTAPAPVEAPTAPAAEAPVEEAPAAPPARQQPADPPRAPKKKKKTGLILGVVVCVLALAVSGLFLFGGFGGPFKLSFQERISIGRMAKQAAEAYRNSVPEGTVPFCFGQTKATLPSILHEAGIDDSATYTMRYNLKKGISKDDYFVVLRTDPPAGEALPEGGRVLVELTQYPVPTGAVYFHGDYDEEGLISRGVYLDKNGDPVLFVMYYYKTDERGYTTIKEAMYDPDGQLTDLWTHEFFGEGYKKSSADTSNASMKQIHYRPDGSIISINTWVNGTWK